VTALVDGFEHAKNRTQTIASNGLTTIFNIYFSP
jgi:hypothetical protein